MHPIVNEPGFQAATAATAAAAASTGNVQLASIMDSIDSETSEAGQYPMEDCGGFMDPEVQRMMRTNNEDASEYPKYGWVDITQSFKSACSELNLGELAQDMLFGLFEAMSAIEMMDPKMDVGMGYNKNDATPHTFESAVEAGVLKLNNLTNEELIGIFDALFTCIVSWLEGNSMDQVLFTCFYLHAPAKIEDKSLKAFCHAVRHLIIHIKNIIISSNVNEEEDFQLYGNSSLLAPEDSFQASLIHAMLKEAEDGLVRQSKMAPQPEEIMAVVHRLRFMRHFYQAIYSLDCAMVNSIDEAVINEIYKHLNTSLELTPQIKKTIDKGTQPIEGSDSPNPIGFSPRIHDRSQPPTFPRSVKMRDRPSSIMFLEELVQRLKYACKVIRMRDYYSALNFFIEFSRKSGQCILSRSVLQGLFISSRRLIFGTIPVKDFLWDSVRVFNSPPILNPKNPLAMERDIQLNLDSFFRYCISTFTQFLRICGFNRARQRDKLGRFIESFDSIQVKAARLDSHLSMLANEKAVEGNEPAATALKFSTQFATWVLYNCFRAMMLYLMSGFELELYSVHEFLYIYWYPYELLIGFIVSALTRTEKNLLAQEEYEKEQLSKLQAKNRNKPKPKKNKKQQQKSYRQEIFYYHALMNMCGGFYKAMCALTKDGRIRQPMPKFDNEEIRFNRRFAPFANLTSPPPVSYEEFKSIREHMMSPPSSDIYDLAAKHFDQARNALESIQNPEQEILDMLQVAKTNYIVMNVLAKGHQKDTKRQPEFDFSKHRHFPIIKLT
ncbi:putative N-alpha-acetyltransferase, 35 NatC auxiliary subunit [Lucilia cuprina]|uniref:Protein MAK10 homolog n=1 Tax=Lucilia cuprina TaxID=7375 RepID=A0A0L0CQL5_LUCCU|nr:35 NatC auxiliary subunit like protein, N-alpha-acetyltransferase [Lucilia cuprina]KNC33729.1 putative N-alpha-acetyltransferase, 35 NatC auxiliary subunit [Lucilia cuprina]